MPIDQASDRPKYSNKRLLKAHKKSRAGCGECKLRKVKCDEGKPVCKRCQTGGHACQYGGNNALFELMVNDVANRKIVDNISFCLRLPQARGHGVHTFSIQDVRLLDRFRSHTALTITTDRNRGIYQNQIVEIAPQYPFLMHTLLALTLMHDRYEKGRREQSPSVEEAYHHYRSTVAFNARVKQPIQPGPSESAAIWASAILTSLISFGRIEETDANDVWPLRSSSRSDLSWLLVGEGKVQLSKMTQLLKTEAQYQGLFPPQAAAIIPKRSTPSEFEALPQELLRLCGLDIIANEKNPYHAVAATYAKSMNKDFASTLVLFFCLVGNIPSNYKELLCQKDPRALLLLALWYVNLSSNDIWWLEPRLRLEGHAICIYLRRSHSQDVDLQDVLTSIWQGLKIQKLAVQNPESLMSQD